MPSALHEFSGELRRHCLRRGSIAQLCKATGMNRQQFNKYLAGQIIPSARNLRKICAYLEVTEAELMSPGARRSEADSSGSGGNDTTIDLSSLAGVIAPRLVPHQHGEAGPANVLPLGYYDCYFPLYAASDNLVRWLLKVKRVGAGLTFTCRTYVRGVRGAISPATRNKYHGVGIAGARETYLIGTSCSQLHQLGILAINQIPVAGRTYFTGLALTPRLDGPVAITTALHYRGTHPGARDLVGSLGIINLADPTLDPVVGRLMRAVPASGANWIQSVNGRSLRSGVLTGGSGFGAFDSDGQMAV